MSFITMLKKYLLLAVIAFTLISSCKTETPVIPEPVQETPPPSPALNTTITYGIEPEKFIKDNYGYIGIKYYTRDEEKEKIKNRLEKKHAAAEDFEKAYRKIPEYGYIVLHIGRQDLMHANTKWYSCSVKRDNIPVFDYKGQEGIPNIKGEDGNWWNIVKLPLRREIESSLSAVITDHKTGNSYSFKVNRIETVQ